MNTAIQSKSDTFRRELSKLFEENYRIVYKAAYGVTENQQDAEDVVQTVFVRLIKKPSPDFINNPPGYLYRAVINEALSLIRSRGRRRVIGHDNLDSLAAPEPAAESDRDQDLQRLQKAMKKINPEQVKILHLHYKEGYSCREIAKRLRRSRGAVIMELIRTRAELKALMQIQEEPSETQKDKHQTDRSPVLADASKA